MEGIMGKGEKKEIRSEILRLVIPVAMENMLQMLAGIVITAMVGRLLADDISAQGISNRVYNTFFALFRGIGMGATVVGAVHCGGGKPNRCRRAIEQSFLTALPLSLLFLALVFVFPKQLLGFFTTDPVLLQTAVRYTRIAIWAIPFMTVICINTAAFNSHGNTRTPMMIAAVMNAFNIAVGYTAIFGVGPIKGLGITGAALATVMTQAVGCLIGLYLLYHKKKGLLSTSSHGQRFFSVDRQEIKEIYASGIPIAFENLFWQFSAILLSKVILGYGSHFYASYQLGLQAEMLTEMPLAGFVMAATTLTARAVGRRDGALFRAYYQALVRMTVIFGAAASLVLLLFPKGIMSILTDKEELQQIGAVYVRMMGVIQIPQMLSKVYSGAIRSSGSKRVPMYITFLGIWAVRVPIAVLAGWVFKADIAWIWTAIALDQVVRLAACMIHIKVKDVTHCVEGMQKQEQAQKGDT